MVQRIEPSWLRLMAPRGNTMGYTSRRCGCGRHVFEVRDRNQWEDYNPGIITSDDLTTAIICRRTLTRLTPTLGAPVLENVWLGAGITPDGMYLERHDCTLAPISERPYEPLTQESRQDLSFLPHVIQHGTDPWAAMENTSTQEVTA